MKINPVAIIVIASGVFFLFKLKGFYILHPKRYAEITKSALSKRGAKSSLCMALAGTLGVGNIFGVAVGIIVGGAGSVFWIALSGIFSSVVKYAEVATAEHYRDTKDEGECAFFHVIRRALPHGALLAPIYALLTVLLSLFMGGAIQMRAAIDCLVFLLDIKPICVALPIGFLVFLAISKGGARIRKITAFILPLTTIIYIIASFWVIFANIGNFVSAIKEIISCAFDIKGCVGGILGFITSGAVKEGFSRGILSNEAGIGSSASSHVFSSADAREKGMLGVLEVVFDTLVLCPITGVAIIASGAVGEGAQGMELVFSAFASVSPVLGALLTVTIIAFAYSTVICWYYYGSSALACIFGRCVKKPFTLAFLLSVAFSYLLPEMLLLSITDTVILLMTMLCIPSLIKSSDRIKELSEL